MRRYCLTSSVAKDLLSYRLKHCANEDDDSNDMDDIDEETLAFVKDWTDVSGGHGAVPEDDNRGDEYHHAHDYILKRFTVPEIKDFIRDWNSKHEDEPSLHLTGRKPELIDRLLDAGFDYTADCPEAAFSHKSLEQVLHNKVGHCKEHPDNSCWEIWHHQLNPFPLLCCKKRQLEEEQDESEVEMTTES